MSTYCNTPASSRMLDSEEYKRYWEAHNAWEKRPTVDNQDCTDQDWADFNKLMEWEAQLEKPTGYHQFTLLFDSNVIPMEEWNHGGMFSLTHEQVGLFLKEFRMYLLGCYQRREHLYSPWDITLMKYKAMCQVYRLGEGAFFA